MIRPEFMLSQAVQALWDSLSLDIFLEHGAKKIAMLNRTPLPKKSEWNPIILNGNDKNLANRLKEIISLENAGADITYMSVDITQGKQLQRAFSHLRKKYGRIRGVINSAGTGVGMHGKNCMIGLKPNYIKLWIIKLSVPGICAPLPKKMNWIFCPFLLSHYANRRQRFRRIRSR